MGRGSARAVAGGAAIATAIAAALLRGLRNDGWRTVAIVALALLALRVVGMLREVARHELVWTRLLVPVVALLEGCGATLGAGGSARLWQLRAATAVMLELVVVAVAVRELRRPRDGSAQVEARLARALESLLPPRVARLASIELTIVGSAFAFALGGWRRPLPGGFTYHRECSLRLLLIALPLLAAGDALLLELVVLPHAPTWVRVAAHGSAIYGVLWLIGVYASCRARPHVMAAGRLVLHRGVLRSLDLAVADIAAVTPLPAFADDWKLRAYCKGASRLDVNGPPIFELSLRSPVRPHGLLGPGAPSSRVLVAVDDPSAFTSALGLERERR